MTYQLIQSQDDKDIPRIHSVYRLPSVSPYIGMDEKNYWRYVTTTENVYFYKIYKDDILVAATHCELEDNILYMDIVVFPEYQRRGIGAQILNDIKERKLGFDFDKICVSIDERNIASQKLFESAGFTRVSKNKELIDYAYSG